MEPCRIEWLTIPAPKLDAAKEFYENTFGFSVARYSDRFWTFNAGNISGGFDSDLAVNDGGIGFSITVSSISQTILKIQENGGTIVKGCFSLGQGAGYCARFYDPNGNLLELYSVNE